MAAEPEDNLALGILGRPHGVTGELVFRPFNPDGTPLDELPLPLPVTLRSKAGTRPAVVVAARPFKEGSLVRLESVASREEAAALTNSELQVSRSLLPPLGPDEHYVDDYLGCTVIDQHGQPRGVVRGAFWNGGQSILEVRDDAGMELLVPAVPAWIRNIDFSRRQIEIDDHT